jgi:hypothetical protein
MQLYQILNIPRQFRRIIRKHWAIDLSKEPEWASLLLSKFGKFSLHHPVISKLKSRISVS